MEAVEQKVDVKKKDKDSEKVEEEIKLSEEDRILKEKLDLAVERLQDEDVNVVLAALELLRTEIREATASMTSVPKPFKFLKEHYPLLQEQYERIKPTAAGPLYCDIMSVLSMTMSEEDDLKCLLYRLEGSRGDIGSWGHSYVQCLCAQIAQERKTRALAAEKIDMDPDIADLMVLVQEIVPHLLQHNAETEAVDILCEIEMLPALVDSPDLDRKTFSRVCLYLLALSKLTNDRESFIEILKVAFEVYKKHSCITDCLRVAVRMADSERIAACFQMAAEQDPEGLIAKQLALMLSSLHTPFEHEDDEIRGLIGNAKLGEYFLSLGRDLDVLEPKTPEDIYKSHLSTTGSVSRRDGTQQVDSARGNLASSFVNGFVNLGFGKDTLITPTDSNWLFRNKEDGAANSVSVFSLETAKVSTAATSGLVNMWNMDELSSMDRFLYSTDQNVKAGAILGAGVCCCGVWDECDPLLALIEDHIVKPSSPIVHRACLMSLALAYAGTNREDVVEYLLPALTESGPTASVEKSGISAICIGMICQGSCNEEVATLMLTRLMEMSDTDLNQQQEACDAIVEAAKTIEHDVSKFGVLVVQSCAYAASGNVLIVQELLRECAEHLKENALHQSAAVLGIALVGLGDELAREMGHRNCNHLLQYGEEPIRRAVPLALAMSHISNPDYDVVDTLNKLTHDHDTETAMAAIFGLGVVGAGTNNSRIAGMLRQLSGFYLTEADPLFVVRIAQGLLHAAKGLVSLDPVMSDRLLVSGVSLSAIVAVLYSALDMKLTFLSKLHYLLFWITPAIRPRMLMTVDKDLEPISVLTRVGQAVDTVALAGKPKAITGFQTHNTPVLLSTMDRAELTSEATGKYKSVVDSVLEGTVILREREATE